MGLTSSSPQRSRKSLNSSFRRQSSVLSEITKKLDEKECVFIAMQTEIDKAIMEHNKTFMLSLASEITAHILDLNQMKQVDLPSGERGRSQRVLYNFELSLAKLKSILNSGTSFRKNNDNAQFFVAKPDIVSDLIQFNDGRRTSSINQNRQSLTALPEYEAPADDVSVLKNNSVYTEPALSIEDILNSVEREFDVLKDQLERHIEDINEYYQMDKGVFFLQVRLKNTEIDSESPLNDKKFLLLKELTEFRAILDNKSGELEEQRQIAEEVNTLELLVDSATEADLESLKARALLFQETIEKSSWDKHFVNKKIQLLRRLAAILERIAFSTSPLKYSLKGSVEHLYGNINSLQKELEELGQMKESESIQTNHNVLEHENTNNNEDVYGNIEIIRQTKVPSKAKRNNSNASQRGTVYANEDVVKQILNLEESSTKPQEVIQKRPLPLPRNYDDKIINDLPKQWQRLNEIFDGEFISEANKAEIAEIQKQAIIAKSLFERKINRIIEKSEESIEL